MRKELKKLLNKILLVVALFITSTCVVNAKSTDVYYINNNGVEMTEEQYNFLLDFYDESQISTMSQKKFNIKINSSNLNSNTKYVVETIAYDRLGNVVETNTTEVATEIEAIEMAEELNEITPFGSVSYSTSAKKITLSTSLTYLNGRYYFCISTDTEWLNNAVPVIKSYDVSAHRFTTSGSLFLNAIDAEGWQTYNSGGSVTYGFLGNNSVKYSNGYGVSMNIADDATRNLKLSLDVLYEYSGSGTAYVYGTYQHATTDVSLDQSKSYTFASGGLGNVLSYSNSTIRGYYDGMQGVSLSHSL